MRAGDHQHGDGARDRGVEVADRRPDDERDDCGGDRDVEQQGSEPIGEYLSSALAGLGVGDEPLDPCQGSVVTDGVDPHPDRAIGRDRAGYHAVADRPVDGLGLTGDHRLVDLGAALDDRAVGGNTCAGSDQHDVADLQFRRRNRADRVAVDEVGLVGQQRGERSERVLCLPDRLHLLPVAEQHDRHERSELPPELEVEPLETRRHRGDVGDADRHRDQQHHPRPAVADLGDAAGEERPATPPEHDRAEDRPVPGHRRRGRPSSRTSPSPSRSSRRAGSSAPGSARTGAGTSPGRARRACRACDLRHDRGRCDRRAREPSGGRRVDRCDQAARRARVLGRGVRNSWRPPRQDQRYP